MAIYDYICEDCGRELEVTQSVHDDELSSIDHMDKSDPAGKKCQGRVKRQLSASSVVWKNGSPTPKHYN